LWESGAVDQTWTGPVVFRNSLAKLQVGSPFDGQGRHVADSVGDGSRTECNKELVFLPGKDDANELSNSLCSDDTLMQKTDTGVRFLQR